MKWITAFKVGEVLERVNYSEINSPVGTIWAATTEKGLIQVHLSSREAAFLNVLKRRVNAEPVYAPERLDALRLKINRYFDGEPLTFNLLLDLRGTRFQEAIWREIYKIPYGKLSSYGRLAAAVGKPKAMRAAGNATGANPIGLIVPCHRVIRSDGGIGGFGGKIFMKEYLLSLEGVIPPANDIKVEISKRNYSYSKEDLRRRFYY